jgi:YD repeat-containing protein
MRLFQPLLLLLTALTQCKAPVKKWPSASEQEAGYILANHIHKSTCYEERFNMNSTLAYRRLTKTCIYNDSGRIVLEIRPHYKLRQYAPGAPVPENLDTDTLTGKTDSIYYSYDAAGHVLKAVTHLHSIPGAPRLETTTYTYDAKGNQVETSIIREDLDTNVLHTSYTYDHDRISYREDIVVGYRAGPEGPRPYRTDYEYDKKGRLIRTGDLVSTYDEDDRVISTENSTEKYTYRYDNAGNNIQETWLKKYEQLHTTDTVSIYYQAFDKRNLLVERKLGRYKNRIKSIYRFEYE